MGRGFSVIGHRFLDPFSGSFSPFRRDLPRHRPGKVYGPAQRIADDLGLHGHQHRLPVTRDRVGIGEIAALDSSVSRGIGPRTASPPTTIRSTVDVYTSYEYGLERGEVTMNVVEGRNPPRRDRNFVDDCGPLTLVRPSRTMSTRMRAQCHTASR